MFASADAQRRAERVIHAALVGSGRLGSNSVRCRARDVHEGLAGLRRGGPEEHQDLCHAAIGQGAERAARFASQAPWRDATNLVPKPGRHDVLERDPPWRCSGRRCARTTRNWATPPATSEGAAAVFFHDDVRLGRYYLHDRVCRRCRSGFRSRCVVVPRPHTVNVALLPPLVDLLGLTPVMSIVWDLLVSSRASPSRAGPSRSTRPLYCSGVTCQKRQVEGGSRMMNVGRLGLGRESDDC